MLAWSSGLRLLDVSAGCGPQCPMHSWNLQELLWIFRNWYDNKSAYKYTKKLYVVPLRKKMFLFCNALNAWDLLISFFNIIFVSAYACKYYWAKVPKKTSVRTSLWTLNEINKRCFKMELTNLHLPRSCMTFPFQMLWKWVFLSTSFLTPRWT